MTAILISACGAGIAGSKDGGIGNDIPQQITLEKEGSVFGDFLAGRHAESVHDAPVAARYFGQAYRKAPDNPELLKRSFLFSAMEGKMEEASKLALKVLENTDSEPVATLVLMTGDVVKGDFAAAEKRLDLLPKTGVSTFMRPLLKAWALAGAGKTAEALKELSRLSGEGGYDSLHDMHAALINEAGGKDKEAEAYYLKAVNSAAGLTLRVTELLGALYERQGQPEKALEVYGKYQTAHPGSLLIDPIITRAGNKKSAAPDSISPKDGISEALFGIASSMRQQNAQDSALIFTRLALRLKPNFPIAQILLADIHEAQARPDDANKAYMKIDKASPFNWTARLRIATNYNTLGKLDEAVSLLKKMAAERPDLYTPLVELGNLLRSHSRFKEAVKAYDQALKRVGKIEPHHWSLLYSRGIALERSKQWDKAEADFLKALEFEPDQPFVLNYLGYSWVEKGLHINKAQKMIEKAVKLRPRDGYIVDSLGWVQYRLGNYLPAVKNLERAIELRPEDPTINDHLGDAYWRIGRKLEAGFQWRRALSLKPEEDLAEIIQDKIDNGLGPAEPIKAQ
ncbi:MAG: tetratricopeptide repeat protein [Alphaproteobacteria bacterium]|nr:tetratricopeptide repeat protein [Rhodospirillales bacterium]MCW9046317.1 tetratricopeptide repeat protein [Alphaproteobacteria bacterium]